MLVSETLGSVGVWIGPSPAVEELPPQSDRWIYTPAVLQRFLDPAGDASEGGSLHFVATHLDEVERVFDPATWQATREQLMRVRSSFVDRVEQPEETVAVISRVLGQDPVSLMWSDAVKLLQRRVREHALGRPQLKFVASFWRADEGAQLDFSGCMVGDPIRDTARLLVKISLADEVFPRRADGTARLVELAVAALPEARQRARSAGYREDFRAAEEALLHSIRG